MRRSIVVAIAAACVLLALGDGPAVAADAANEKLIMGFEKDELAAKRKGFFGSMKEA